MLNKKIVRLIIITIVSLFLFAIPVAADITGGSVTNTNIYGTSEVYDVAPSGYSGVTTSNITHVANQYINASYLTATVDDDGNIVYKIYTTINSSTFEGYQGSAILSGETGTQCGMTWVYDYTKDGQPSGQLTATTYDQTYTIQQNGTYVTSLTLSKEYVSVGKANVFLLFKMCS